VSIQTSRVSDGLVMCVGFVVASVNLAGIAQAATFNVSSMAALETRMNAAVPGNLIMLANGTDLAPGPSCVTGAEGNFQNSTFSDQTGTFTFEYDATPSATPINGYVALSREAQTAHTMFAVLARFNPDGNIDARNGETYAAVTTLPYAANVRYHFRLAVNVASHTYSVFVTPAGGNEQTVGSNFAFRTEQGRVTSLNNWAVWASVNWAEGATNGTLSVCGFTVR
jgi:hypothetical protein